MGVARRLLRLGLIAILMTAGLVVAVPAGPASAAVARNGICEAGEFCLYYNSDLGGSVSDFNTSIEDYGASQPTCYEFRGPGAGQGQCVKNNAASAWNRRSGSGSVIVYYNSGWEGYAQLIFNGSWENLIEQLKNDNASHKYFY
ncbi:peptidase inhibitor family I36 protein [Plantactinospora sp. CA-294935]|uniref:peptidase inhibitor family I36 protein n=1 Tax=Plantactinospora sp. CA-294935 TaxID=3240012 RepID=UPI003D94CBAE